MINEKNLEAQIQKIYVILNEIKNNQNKQLMNIQNSQNIILSKIEKLQEYNEIDDMVNAITDRRLLKIEQKLKQ